MAIAEAWRGARLLSGDQRLPWSKIDGSTVVATGATGLIGSQLVRVLIERSRYTGEPISLVLPVRNEAKAVSLFGRSDAVKYIPWSLGEPLPREAMGDYFVHAACPTSSEAFLRRPLEVISDITESARAVIDSARTGHIQKCVYLSTMEVYGDVSGKVDERANGILDTMNPRSSYPEAKRLAECMFAAANSELNIPTCVLRLAQTFGAGVPQNDGRVFAEFGRCAASGEDIVLLSDGSKQNSYLSVNDAVAAILFLLASGEPGEAYNAANPETFCTILEMAQMVANDFGQDECSVTFGEDAERAKSFRPGSILDLDCSKLMNLGWQPSETLQDMYAAMLSGWAEDE